MGIGGGIFLIALGAILAFAVHAQINWLNLGIVGWILMLAGISILWITIWFWNNRRRRQRLTLVEQSQLEGQHGKIPASPSDEMRLPPPPPPHPPTV